MVDTKQARWVYRVDENFAGVCFWGFGIFFCFAETSIVKQECSVIARWRDFIPSKLCYFKIVSLVCQFLLIAGLNIRSIQLN